MSPNELQEHVTRVASGEGSSRRAPLTSTSCRSGHERRPARRRRARVVIAVRIGGAAPLQPPSGPLGRGQIGEGRCRRAQAPAEVRPQLAARESRSAALRACLDRNRWTAAAFDTERWIGAFEAGASAICAIHRYGLAPMHVLMPTRHLPGV